MEIEERDRLEQLRLEELRKEIQIGIEQADRGECEPLDMDAIRVESAQRLAEKRKSRAGNPFC